MFSDYFKTDYFSIWLHGGTFYKAHTLKLNNQFTNLAIIYPTLWIYLVRSFVYNQEKIDDQDPWTFMIKKDEWTSTLVVEVQVKKF